MSKIKDILQQYSYEQYDDNENYLADHIDSDEVEKAINQYIKTIIGKYESLTSALDEDSYEKHIRNDLREKQLKAANLKY